MTPPGTTHVLPAPPLDFDQRPTFMRWAFDFLGPESGTAYHCWYHWYQGAWHKDYGFWDKHKRLEVYDAGKTYG